MSACLTFLRRPARLAAGLAACLAMLPLTGYTQTVPDWTSVQLGASGAALAVDAANQTLVAGSVAGPAMQVTKLSAAGATLWQRSVDPLGSLGRSTGITTDASGNALVTGYLLNANGQSQGAVVAKLDAAGNVLWRDATPATFGLAHKALVDAAGNVYVLGQQSTPNAAGTLVQEVTLTQYTAAGLRQWVRTWGANFAAAQDAMVLTPGGQVVVAGRSSSGGDARIAAFDASGNLLWSTPLATNELPGLAVAANGELAVVGGSGSGFLVARLNAGFGPMWVRSFPARGYAMRAAFDAAGNLLVSGVSDTNTGNLTVIQYSWMTMKVDPAGNLLWTHTLSASSLGGEVPAALAVGSDGAAYLTGQGRVPLATGGSVGSTTTLKLAANGTQVWRADTSATNQSVGLKLGTDGGVRVLGNNPLWLARYPQSGLANQAPTALATANPSAGPAPLSVQFSAAGSSDPDGAIASYNWDFGDGQASTAANPTHVYAAGQYTARLTVTDALGASSAPAAVVVSANAVAVAKPTALSLGSFAVTGGSSTTGRVTVSSSAGVTVNLSSSNTAVARVPATVVVPAGATSATFTITTLTVRRDTSVTLSAAANGAKVSAVLKVRKR
jgi:PKD repeat protein